MIVVWQDRSTYQDNISICYLDVNWLIPKISACQARIWSLLASEQSEWVTNFIFCRAGWYFSVSIIFTFRWHVYRPLKINHKHSIFAGSLQIYHSFLQVYINVKIVAFFLLWWYSLFFYLLQKSKSPIFIKGFVYQCHSGLENMKVTTFLMTSQQRLSRIV